MIYLDPTNDVAFKKLFGDIAHKDIIISFLNSVLERKNERKIIDITINDPNNHPEINSPEEQSKSSIVDVRCTDELKRQYIIEMQVASQRFFTTRAEYYTASAFSRQLGKSQRFDTIVPVIFVGILDFNLFKNDNNYLSHNLTIDTKTGEQKCNGMEYHFVELKKFTKKLEELTTLAEKWIYFLSNVHEQNKVPDNLTELEEAFLVLNKNSWKVKELEEYERHLNSARIKNDEMDTAKYESEKKGRAIGKVEGLVEGEKNAQIKIAKQLLSLHDIATISQITGLKIEDIEKLKKQ